MAEHVFSAVPQIDIQRSTFDRSSKLLTSFNVNNLVPIFVDEVLPGDTFDLQCNNFSRLSTLVTPIMDDLYIDTFFFFVPERLVFDKFQRMCGEQPNPGDSTDFTFPKLNAFRAEEGSIADYFGIPVNVDIPDGVVRAEPFRAYNLIYNEWFRDENLINRLPQNNTEKYDDITDYKLVPRCKRHDYFTSCLPWPQKGPAVDLPIGGHIPVFGSSVENESFAPLTSRNYGNKYYFASDSAGNGSFRDSVTGDWVRKNDSLRISTKSDMETQFGPGKSWAYADLSQNARLTINDFRQAYSMQRFFERKARGGSRYNEILRSFYGVTPPDLRLQRPEFLVGGSQPMNITSVAQTSSTDSKSPQGHLSAIGVGADQTRFVKSFTEHGWIIGLANVRSNNIYQQGLNKMLSRTTVYDMYWPSFAHLGEQAVTNSEIYLTGTESDKEVFGYQERYAEYRYSPNRITGKLRSGVSQSLDVWHLAQHFDSLPKLNQSFIQESVPIERVVAVTNQPNIIADFWFNLKCTRPMPLYGVPGLSDHF